MTFGSIFQTPSGGDLIVKNTNMIFFFFFAFYTFTSRRVEKNLMVFFSKNEVPKKDFFMLRSDFSLMKSNRSKEENDKIMFF